MKKQLLALAATLVVGAQALAADIKLVVQADQPGPVIHRNIYGQLLSGKVQSWSKIAGAGAGNVVVCRRVSGSGTQATYGWFFGGFPCTSGNIASSVNAPLAGESDSTSYGPYMGAGSGTSADPYIMDPTAGYTVIELGSSGDVRNCLKTANAGGTLNYSKYEVDQLSGVAQTNVAGETTTVFSIPASVCARSGFCSSSCMRMPRVSRRSRNSGSANASR